KLNNIHDELNDYLIQTKLNIYTINIDEFVGLKIKYKIKEVFILAIFENKTLIFSTSNMKLVVEILKQENI
ncbi:hypothetical protein IKS57_04715, partial [bacterium]|nr:hypothetical protein [bacterium]